MSYVRRHAIITHCNDRCGDYLVQHWWRSLRENVNLDGVDVWVLDYGLNDQQRAALTSDGVKLFPCQQHGNISICCLEDAIRLLESHDYDQAVRMDGGDIIFQRDIRHLFDEHQESVRIAAEPFDSARHDVFMKYDDFDEETTTAILTSLRGKRILNAGVTFAPSALLCEVFRETLSLFRMRQTYCCDQLALNYVIYRRGYKPLDERYNFIPLVTLSPYRIERGVFLDAAGERIPLVHNAGGSDSLRVIDNFGYGETRNKRLYLVPTMVRMATYVVNFFKGWVRRPDRVYFFFVDRLPGKREEPQTSQAAARS